MSGIFQTHVDKQTGDFGHLVFDWLVGCLVGWPAAWTGVKNQDPRPKEPKNEKSEIRNQEPEARAHRRKQTWDLGSENEILETG